MPLKSLGAIEPPPEKSQRSKTKPLLLSVPMRIDRPMVLQLVKVVLVTRPSSCTTLWNVQFVKVQFCRAVRWTLLPRKSQSTKARFCHGMAWKTP